MLAAYPLMSAVQLVSGRIGRVTGLGLAANLKNLMPKWMLLTLVGLLIVANTINIGANLAAMGEAGELVTGLSHVFFVVIFALLSLGLQLFLTYERYATYSNGSRLCFLRMLRCCL